MLKIIIIIVIINVIIIKVLGQGKSGKLRVWGIFNICILKLVQFGFDNLQFIKFDLLFLFLMEIYLILELIIIKVGLLLSVKGLVVDLAGYYY